MIQRKSKAYDDVENFENKFTADYLFLINQTESDLPVVTRGVMDLKREMDAQWDVLRNRADALDRRVADLNKRLSDAGIGPVWHK